MKVLHRIGRSESIGRGGGASRPERIRGCHGEGVVSARAWVAVDDVIATGGKGRGAARIAADVERCAGRRRAEMTTVIVRDGVASDLAAAGTDRRSPIDVGIVVTADAGGHVGWRAG